MPSPPLLLVEDELGVTAGVEHADEAPGATLEAVAANSEERASSEAAAAKSESTAANTEARAWAQAQRRPSSQAASKLGGGGGELEIGGGKIGG